MISNDENEIIINKSASNESCDYDDYDSDEDSSDYEDEEEETEVDHLQNMSPNLMRALGLTVPDELEKMNVEWKPPDHSGLDNSEPLVENDLKLTTVESPKDQRNLSKSNDHLTTENHEEENVGNNVEEEQLEEGDDGESEYEESEDEENENRVIPTSALSPNLMKILGLQVPEEKVEIDWKPPTHHGLTNSDRILPRHSRITRLFRSQSAKFG